MNSQYGHAFIRSEDDGKRALDRLKATRAGHRGGATKLVKSIDELLDDPTTDQPRCETLYELLEAKSKTLSTLGDQILERIEIEAIETEIEESSEVTLSGIINAKLTKPIAETKTNDGNSTTTKEITTKETRDVTNSTNTLSTEGKEVEGENVDPKAATHAKTNTNTNTNITNTQNDGGPVSTTAQYTKPPLPKLTLSKFKGDVTKWN